MFSSLAFPHAFTGTFFTPSIGSGERKKGGFVMVSKQGKEGGGQGGVDGVWLLHVVHRLLIATKH